MWRKTHIRSMPYQRVLLCGAVLIVMGCARTPPRVESVPIDADAPPFVGWIKQTHGAMISLDEDARTTVRRAEVFISPTTEIVMRNGMLWPAHWLRPGLRVTIWFTGHGSETDGIVRATAQKLLVDQ